MVTDQYNPNCFAEGEDCFSLSALQLNVYNAKRQANFCGRSLTGDLKGYLLSPRTKETTHERIMTLFIGGCLTQYRIVGCPSSENQCDALQG